MRRFAAAIACGSVGGAWLMPAVARACAVCWTAAGSPAQDPWARGLTWGLLFLMAMPFAVAASIGGWLWVAHRRGRGGRGTTVQGLAWTERGSDG